MKNVKNSTRNHKKHLGRHNKHQKMFQALIHLADSQIRYISAVNEKHTEKNQKPTEFAKSICRYETCKLQHNSLIKF